MCGLPLQILSIIGLSTFCLAAIFFGSADDKARVFVVVSIPTYFWARLTWKSNVSGNFSIWFLVACL